MERGGTTDDARPLPFEQAELSREAYAETVRGCRLAGSAERIALWMVETGRKEVVDGHRVMIVPLPPQRELAGRLGLGVASICRGLKHLEAQGVFLKRPPDGVLNLSRVCELADARATDGEPTGFSSGWRPRARSDVPPRSTAFQRVPARSSAFHPRRSEKEAQEKPEYREPNRTETESDSALRRGDGTPRNSRNIREALQSLNRSGAWQDLQNRDFMASGGARRVPDMQKLVPALMVAVRLGLVRDDYDGQVQWLATVHDCTLHARTPAGALAWRTASGKLHWINQNSYDWAKRILRRAEDRPQPVSDRES